MVTREKINIYKRYIGDIDGWARGGSKHEKSVMSDNDWTVIDEFIQDIALEKRGLIANEFQSNLKRRLKELCEDEATIKELEELSKIMG